MHMGTCTNNETPLGDSLLLVQKLSVHVPITILITDNPPCNVNEASSLLVRTGPNLIKRLGAYLGA